MNSKSRQVKSRNETHDMLACLEPHIRAQMQSGTFTTIIHVGNSAYLRLIHNLICQLLLAKRRVYVFDYNRSIKSVYLQQLLQQQSLGSLQAYKHLVLRVILDDDHAMRELLRLQNRSLQKHKPPVLFMVDPSGLFGRLRGGVKQSAQALQFQYEAAQLFTQKGYAVIVTDYGGREFHRINSLIPTQLKKPATLLLQFLPRRIILS